MLSFKAGCLNVLVLLTFVCVLVVSELRFYQERKSPELSLLCRLDDPAFSKFKQVDSLVISRLQDGTRHVLASVSSHSDKTSPFSRVSDAEVTGHITYTISSSQYLRIVWANPTPQLDGNYTCEAYGVDSNFIPQAISQHLRVKANIVGLVMVATPEVIKIGLSKQLQIFCTLPNHAALNITKIASLEIFKQQNGLKCQFARIKAESGEAILSGAVNASLNGTTNDNQTYLELTWGNITQADAGEFICEGSGVDTKGHPKFFSRSINVTWRNPDREELIQMLFDMYNKEEIYEKIQEERKRSLQAANVLTDNFNRTQCRKPNSCDSAFFEYGERVVSVEPDDGLGPISVLCEGTTPGEMWTVFQKRFNGSVDFYRNISDYEEGFGSLDGEFWLGLKNIRRLLLQNEDKNKLRVEITEMTSEKNTTKSYHSFSVGPPPGYKLNVVGYDDLGYGMSFNSGYNFSTPDQGVPRLAVLNRGGWWYNYESPYVNLNGVWGVKGKRYSVYWSEFRRDRNIILEKTEMKFRRNF